MGLASGARLEAMCLHVNGPVSMRIKPVKRSNFKSKDLTVDVAATIYVGDWLKQGICSRARATKRSKERYSRGGMPARQLSARLFKEGATQNLQHLFNSPNLI